MLAEAARIQETYSLEDALSYLRATGVPSQETIAHIFRANAAVDDETWQTHMNAYLATFDLAPVQLAAGPQSRFLRLTAAPPATVTDGPLISVIMTTFNAGQTVRHSIRSILDQSWRNLELIIIDDASTDKTWQVLQEMPPMDSRVRVFRNPANVGPYVSKNIALEMVAGEFFTCQDADDWAHPQRLERQMESAEAGSGAPATVALCVRLTDDLKIRKFSGSGSRETDAIAHVGMITAMFRTITFREILGHWDTVRFSADIELYRRAQLAFGAGLRQSNVASYFALDAEGSLTSDPVYGTRIGPGKKLSPVRAEYKKNFEAWQDQALPQTSYLEFPHLVRKFAAPAPMLPDPANIEAVIAHGRAVLGAAKSARAVKSGGP